MCPGHMHFMEIAQSTDFWAEDEMKNTKCVTGVNTNAYFVRFFDISGQETWTN